MPAYDVVCAKEHAREVIATMAQAREGLSCPDCQRPARIVISPAYLPAARIDAAGDIRRYDPDPRSRGLNVGLGVPASQASSNAACREIAKRKGLTPLDSGAYRSTPR